MGKINERDESITKKRKKKDITIDDVVAKNGNVKRRKTRSLRNKLYKHVFISLLHSLCICVCC